jgi:hypothetical protein
MKTTSLLTGACFLAIMTGCHKPQISELVGEAEAAVKTAALPSISAKYPGVGSSDLKLDEFSIKTLDAGQETVFVRYALPATATTNMEGRKTIIMTRTIGVSVSLTGKVTYIYESTNKETLTPHSY